MAAFLASLSFSFLIGVFGILLILALRWTAVRDGTAMKSARKREALDASFGGALAGAAALAVGVDRRRLAAASENLGNEDTEEADNESNVGSDEEAEIPNRRRELRERKKDERRARRHAEQQARRDRDERKLERQFESGEKQRDREALRKKAEDAENVEAEVKDRKDREDFLKWKKSFSVAEEGEESGASAATAESFVEWIKIRKVVNLEDLSSAFRLPTAAAIERIHQLEKLDRLTGIFDDRGKYIYISADEMQMVASWISSKGRFNRAELVATCNHIIRFSPTVEDKAKLDLEAQAEAEKLLTPE